uniref:Neurexophilin and PC-esterase domain family, member 3 n=1 Tax=Neogobius melanostomus TaxID=47308 RepID=A0A8C6SEJ5_9GOBI
MTTIYSNFKTDFEIKTLPPPLDTSTHSPTSTTQSKPAVQRCSYTYLSPDNAEEGRRLLDSIAWPETPPLHKPFSLNLTTSAAKSSFSIVPRSGGWKVGDKLTVTIQLRDFNGNPKKGGGDFIFSRLHNRTLGAAVVGQVQDHLNGTFTAVFPLLWNGTANVEVTLVHSSESITVLKRVTEEQPGRIHFTSEFRSGSVKMQTICNVCLDPGSGPLCNFTDLNTGEQWFCYKPKSLDCNTRISHSSAHVRGGISKEEGTLFQKGINLKAPIKALGKENIMILPTAAIPTAKNVTSGPSGYYYSDQWRRLRGPDVRHFNNASVITACLKGKRLHLLGDSTIRQLYELITKTVPNLQRFDTYSSSQTGPFLAVDHTNTLWCLITVIVLPFASPSSLCPSCVTWLMNWMDWQVDRKLCSDRHLGALHLLPLEVYYQRLMTVRRAVQRLLSRAPETRVIVRSANMKSLDLFQSWTASDWYALQVDKVLRAVFEDMDVLLLDVWDMVQAHYLPHNLHPPPPIIKQMIDVVLSYVCPGKQV